MCDPSANTSGFLDRCITLLVEHKLTTETASMIKYSGTDMCGKVVDECLHYSRLWIYVGLSISRMYVDNRIWFMELMKL
jgi:acyl-CoA dehydrogenase